MLPNTKRKVQKLIISVTKTLVCAVLLINCKNAIVNVYAYCNTPEIEPVEIIGEPIIIDNEDIENNIGAIDNTTLSTDVIDTAEIISDNNKAKCDDIIIDTAGSDVDNITDDVDYLEGYETPQYIRCTGYCDYGYTKSGEYVRDGIVAGKKEWLGKKCYVYAVAEDGTCGDIIGEYDFLDTGYGINGSLIKGTSIDIWHPSESEVWAFAREYGDYVYIQIANE